MPSQDTTIAYVNKYMSEQRIVIESSGGTLPVSVSVVGGVSLSGATIASNVSGNLMGFISGSIFQLSGLSVFISGHI
jgi:hypothetical protein